MDIIERSYILITSGKKRVKLFYFPQNSIADCDVVLTLKLL